MVMAMIKKEKANDDDDDDDGNDEGIMSSISSNDQNRHSHVSSTCKKLKKNIKIVENIHAEFCVYQVTSLF